jgi:condensin complex subunit 2
MSRLDSAFDIDPLFHKMSKSFDEGGAKGLLLGNLGVSQRGCRIVFDSKEDEQDEENNNNSDSVGDVKPNEEEGENVTTSLKNNEREIDVSRLGAKLASTLASCGYRSPASAPFVPQLESLRRDYALLEAEGYEVDERAQEVGRKRLRLYDAP